MVFRLVCALALLATAGASPARAATVSVPGDFPTIQAAIDGAPGGSVVQIAPGTHTEVLNLNGITRELTLRGDPSNPASVVIDGGGVQGSTVTVVGCGSNVVFEGLTITGGRGGAGLGGGLFLANSDAVFTNVTFTGNSNTADGGGAFILTSGGFFRDCVFRGNSAVRFGGGVTLNVGATTIFERCSFVENQSGTGDDVSGWGGGLHVNDSSPTLIGCVIANNRSKFAGGGISATGHYNVAESYLTLRDCEIADNEAVRGNPSIAFTDGGGVHVEDNIRAVVERCHVHGNTASNGGGLSAYRATYEISDSLVEGNHAVAVTPDVAGGFGGGIVANSVNTSQPTRKAASVTMRRSAVRDNAAHVGGGLFVQGDFGGLTSNQATLILEDSLVGGNVASGRGGGLFVGWAVANLRRSHVLANQVTAASNAWGGGLVSIGGSATAIEDSAICSNRTAEYGGGIFADQGGSLTVVRSHLFDNAAFGGSGVGGAIAVSGGAGPTPGPVTGTVSDSVLGDNGAAAEIWELDCNASMWSQVSYTDNTIHVAGAGVYARNCASLVASVAAFNALGKASGNVDAPPVFGDFLAAPATIGPGATSVLSWCAPGGGRLAIDQGVGDLATPVGTQDVTPDTTTTYTLSRNGNLLETAAVNVACTSVGTPIPATPSNGRQAQDPAQVTLRWYAASGAQAYDVYLDASNDPTTLVGGDLTTTNLVVDGLQPGTTYRWKVVAKSPTCANPVASPVFTFQTCAGSVCFSDDFGDADVSDWSTIGRGIRDAVEGGMRVKGRRRFAAMAPVPSVGDGRIAAHLDFRSGREVRLRFAQQSATVYRQLVMRANGRMRLEEKIGRRTRRRASGHAPLPKGGFQVTLELAGGNVVASVDGTQVLAAAFGATMSGQVGVQVTNTNVLVDDVFIEGNP